MKRWFFRKKTPDYSNDITNPQKPFLWRVLVSLVKSPFVLFSFFFRPITALGKVGISVKPLLAFLGISAVLGLSLPYASSYLSKDKPPPENLRQVSQAVLASSIVPSLQGNIVFNIPATFNEDVTLNKGLKVQGLTVIGDSVLNGSLTVKGKTIDVGGGNIVASNVVYSITAGSGISVGSGQNPTITNNGVTSFQGSTGSVTLSAGSGISVSGTTITNSDTGSAQSIFKNIKVGSSTITASSNTDSLTFVAGTGVTLSADTTNKQVTITSTGGLSGLTTNGVLYASNSTTAVSLAPGTAGYVLSSNGSGAAPSWIAAGSSVIQRNLGVVSPTNITDDLVIGGVATASSKFQVFGNNGNIAATGTLTGLTGLTSSGTIAFTGLGTGVVQSTAGTLGVAAVNLGTQVTSTLPVGNGGTGTTTFTSNGILYGNSTNAIQVTAQGAAGTVLHGNGGVPSFSAVSLTADISGILPVGNGGTGILTTPTSGQLLIGNASNGYTLANITGTTNQVTVTNGSGTITLATPQNINSGASPTFAALSLTNNTNQLTLGTTTTGIITMAALGSSRTYTLPDATGTFCLTSGNCIGGGGGAIGGSGTNNYIAKFTPDTSHIGNSLLYDTGTTVGIGTTIPDGFFVVKGGYAGNAAEIVNQIGASTNDIWTASASGTTKFVIANNGNIQFSGSTANLSTLTKTGTSVQTYTFPDATGTICLTTGNCAGAGTGLTGSGTATQIAFFSGASNNLSSDSNLYWNNVSKLFAIGSSSPVGMLDLSGAVKGKALSIFNETGDQAIFTASASGSPVFTILHSGNVGIGTTGPSYPLSVSDNGVAAAASFTNTGASTSFAKIWPFTDGKIYIQSGTADSVNSFAPFIFSSVGTTNPFLAIVPSSATVASVGIGTSAPAGSFEVQAASGTHDPLAKFDSPGATNSNSIYLANGTGTFSFFIVGAANDFMPNTAAGDGGIRVNPAQKLFFGDSTTTRMVIDSSSHVGIGTTTINSVLDFGAASASNKIYLVDSGTDKYGFGATGGALQIYTGAASGTNFTQFGKYDGTTFTEYMRLNNSGNVGIGTTTVVSKLDLEGAVVGKALSIFNETGDQAIFTASASGVPEFTIKHDGTLVAAKYATQNGVLYISDTAGTVAQTAQGAAGTVLHGNGGVPSFSAVSLTADVGATILPLANGGTNANLTADNGGIVYSGSSALAILAHNANAGLALVSGGAGAPTWFAPTLGSIIFAGANGALAQNNASFFWDNTNNKLAIGSSSPVGMLDLGGAVKGKALSIFNETGDQAIFTASASGSTVFTIAHSGTLNLQNSQTITGVTNFTQFSNGISVGGATTYNIANTGVATLFTGSNVTNNGASYFQVGSTAGAGSYVRLYADVNAVGDFALTDSNAVPYLYTNVTGATGSFIPAGATGIGKNVTAPHAILDVEGGNTGGNAALIVNQNGASTNDIFDASTSGTLKFAVQNDGTLIAAKYTTQGGLFFANNTTGTITQTAQGTAAQCLLGGTAPSWSQCALGTNWLTSSSGALYPINTTLDFLIGGTSTASADFAFTNLATGINPTLTIGKTGVANGIINLDSSGAGKTAASISADLNGGLNLTAPSGIITIGNGSGDITLDPGGSNLVANLSGNGSFLVEAAGATYVTFDKNSVTTFAFPGTTTTAVTVTGSSLTTGQDLSMTGGTAMTTGNLLSLSSATYVHTVAAEVGKAINLTFTDNSTLNAAGTTQTIGLNVMPTFGATGASGTHELYGAYFQTPTINAPTGTNNLYGIRIGNQGASGVTNAYGLYVNSQSGATNNYAAVFGGGNVGIGTTNPAYGLDVNQLTTAFNSSDNGTLGTWTTNSVTLSQAMRNMGVVTANGYVYSVGGNNGAAISNVYYARLNASGSVDNWVSTTALPGPRYTGGSFTANGYIYWLGGFDASAANAGVYYAKLNADGSVGSWSTTNSLPAARYAFELTTANGYVYVAGGVNSASTVVNTIWYAKLNPDGTIGPWNTTTNTPSGGGTGIAYGVASAANGYFYLIGGYNGTSTIANAYVLKINSDGTLGTAITTTSLPAATSKLAGFEANGYVYILGGTTDNANTGAVSTVYYAKLNSDGTLGSWTTNTNALPAAVFLEQTVASNGNVYVLGGVNGSNSLVSTTYYSSTARVSIAADLDLLGLTSQSLASSSGIPGGIGGTGGSIYAGNIFSNGGLQVIGNALFNNSVGLVGNLSINGTSYISGANIGEALSIFNETGDQNILTASASGTTKFSVDRSGDLITAAGAKWMPVSDSTTALQVANAGGTAFVNFDTTNSRVGIGTTAPAFKLDVQDTQASTVAAMFTNLNSGTTSDVIGLKTAATSPGLTNNFITFLDGKGEIIGKVTGTASGTGVAYTTTGIDFAEYFKKDVTAENLTPGTVVCQGANGVTACAAGGHIIGVVSDRAGFTGGGEHAGDPSYVLVGLVGQLPVKIASNSGILSGDHLMIDSSGVATKATKTGETVGIALQDQSAANNGMVMTSINASWYDPTFVSLVTTQGGFGVSTQAAALLPALQNVPLLTADIATISGTLNVLGRTTVTDIGITGNFNNGLITMHGLLGEINTLSGDLKLQSEGLGGINILNGLVMIDVSGNVTTKGVLSASTVKAGQFTVSGGNSTGSSTIPSGQTSVIISASATQTTSKIFLTPTVITSKQLVVTQKGAGQFTVSINGADTKDITFDWFIVGNE